MAWFLAFPALFAFGWTPRMAGWVPTIATFRRLIGRPVKDSVHSLLLVYAFSLGLDVEGGASIFIAGLQITLVGVAVCLDFLICCIS